MLSAAVRERIGIVVAAANDCSCCVAARTGLGRDAGAVSSDIVAASRVRSADSTNAPALRFALVVMESRGHVSECETATLRASFDRAAIAETAATVAINMFANIINEMGNAAGPRRPDSLTRPATAMDARVMAWHDPAFPNR